MASSNHITTKALKGLAIFAIATGSSGVLRGIDNIYTFSASQPYPLSKTVTIMDSQLRYLGACWAGIGALLWWASNDLEQRRGPLGLLYGAIFFGGIGRAISGWKYGFHSTFLQLATAVELLGPIVLTTFTSAGPVQDSP